MVKFDANEKINMERPIDELYAIYGKDEDEKEILLVAGVFEDGCRISVMNLSSIIHCTRIYDSITTALEVCEDWGIVPSTAQCIDDYKAFTLIFQHDERED